MLNGKFLCVKSDGNQGLMEKNKIYEFKNGGTTWDDKTTSRSYTSIEDFNDYLQHLGIEISPVQKLHIEFRQWDNTVSAKVLYQDESLRCSGIGKGLALARESNGYSIRSWDNIEIYSNGTFYIQGYDKNNDDKIAFNRFNTTEEATEWLKNIQLLIDQINAEPNEIEKIQDKMSLLQGELEELKNKLEEMINNELGKIKNESIYLVV